ncbi:MAG: hypothetical protein EXS63_09120 [Candidatus Omnitrophica bacterium]|nr:hypothetical protein [Candidatus Omnitrophota bacterium]
MRICFFLSVYEIFFQRISEVLREAIPAPEFTGIAYGKLGPIRLRQTRTKWGEIAVFTDYLREQGMDKPFDLSFLQEKDRELGIPNINFYISADRYISKLKYEDAMRSLELCIRFVEEALERQKPDLIIMDDVCCMLSYLIYQIGKKRGLPVWSLGSLKINHRLSIYDDCLDRRDKVENAYQELKKLPLTFEEKKLAEDYLHQYTHHYEPLLYLKTRSKVPDLSLKMLTEWLRLSLHHLKDPLDVTRMSFGELARSRVFRVVRHYAGKVSGLFEKPVAGEKYVFFPLQVQPERSTLILAPFHCDQLALIENISKSLPVGYRLYVKDHPIFLGRRPLGEYQRLKKIYNVRLLDASLPSFEIVKNASLVMTISNTIGIEAIFLERPLIVMGDTFYRHYDNALYVDQVKQLPEKIKTLIDTFKPDREDLLRFINALFKGSYPGTRRQPNAVPYVVSRENVRDVSAALLEEMGLVFGEKFKLSPLKQPALSSSDSTPLRF